MADSPQQAGRGYEERFAERYGFRLMPASGATPRYKLDVGQVEVVASLKHTTKESFRITAADLRELAAGAGGPGGRGQLGVLVAEIEGIEEEVATMRLSDLFALLRGEIRIDLQPSLLQRKLAQADARAYLGADDGPA